MHDLICDTSVLQYLYQINSLDWLRLLARSVTVPEAVCGELAEGLAQGVRLPMLEAYSWIRVCVPVHLPVLPLITDLGVGEAQALALGIEMKGAIVVLDDGPARRIAAHLKIPFTGTLGVILAAKRKGLCAEVRPLLDELDRLRFRIARQTRDEILMLAGEAMRSE